MLLRSRGQISNIKPLYKPTNGILPKWWVSFITIFSKPWIWIPQVPPRNRRPWSSAPAPSRRWHPRRPDAPKRRKPMPRRRWARQAPSGGWAVHRRWRRVLYMYIYIYDLYTVVIQDSIYTVYMFTVVNLYLEPPDSCVGTKTYFGGFIGVSTPDVCGQIIRQLQQLVHHSGWWSVIAIYYIQVGHFSQSDQKWPKESSLLAQQDGFFAASPQKYRAVGEILTSLGKQAGGQVILQFPCKWFVVELEVFFLSIEKTCWQREEINTSPLHH